MDIGEGKTLKYPYNYAGFLTFSRIIGKIKNKEQKQIKTLSKKR